MPTYTVLITDEEDGIGSIEKFANELQIACDAGYLPGSNFLVIERTEDDTYFWNKWKSLVRVR